MKTPRTRFAALTGALLILPMAGTATAQDEDSAYVYASYYECGPGMGEALRTLREDWGPIIQRKIDAGAVAAWGVLTHDTGNPWSMAIYEVGDDLGALMTALDEAIAEYFEAHSEAGAQFGRTCPRHEDYIWATGVGSEAGAGVAQDRAEAAMSVYWVCDEGTEALADLVVESLWAPVLNRQVAEGKLHSWGWLEHWVGGEYRRLLVTDGADHATLLEARNEFLEATAAEDAALAGAFSSVCNGHTDILWDVAVSAP